MTRLNNSSFGRPSGVGVIVGSDYNRNENGSIIIAEDGFPTRADENRIIGDPTPLFNYIYALELNLNQVFLKFIIDGQIGGKVWNGTQQTLDYYGVSQNSADQREITNYIFDGVKSDGTINDIEVSLADSNNGLSNYFWARYGEEGIASEYIQNATHISLKSIELSYWQRRRNQSNIKVTVFAKNLLTIGNFPGYTTSNLYEDGISYGIQYFNQPITSEIGTSLTYIF